MILPGGPVNSAPQDKRVDDQPPGTFSLGVTMPPVAKWPEWIKGCLAAAMGGVIAVFGMGLTEGARRSEANAVSELVKAHEPRIKILELQAAADMEWKAWLRVTLEEMRSDIKAMKK